jgi:hypothetical protein
MNFLIAKRADGIRVSFSVSISAGVLRTGLTSGNFTVTVVSPGDDASALYPVSESTQKGGLYFFDVPAAFFIANGVGDYPAVIEVAASAPKLNAVASTMISVSEQDLNSLAAAVWDEPAGSHVAAGSTGLSAVLTRYGGAVHIDTKSGAAGTAYPLGTEEYPVDNIDDALSIAGGLGIRRFHVRGNLALTTSMPDWVFVGDGEEAEINFGGQDVSNSEFSGFVLTGQISNGPVTVTNCHLDGVDLFYGTAVSSSITASGVELGGSARFVDCSSAVPGTNTPFINVNGTGRSLELRGYSGGIRIVGLASAGDNVSIDLLAGQVVLDASCTAGTVAIRGVGNLTELQGPGVVVSKNGLVNQSAFADAVWDEIMAGHTVPGSSAQLLKLVQAVLGLVS